MQSTLTHKWEVRSQDAFRSHLFSERWSLKMTHYHNFIRSTFRSIPSSAYIYEDSTVHNPDKSERLFQPTFWVTQYKYCNHSFNDYFFPVDFDWNADICVHFLTYNEFVVIVKTFSSDHANHSSKCILSKHQRWNFSNNYSARIKVQCYMFTAPFY